MKLEYFEFNKWLFRQDAITSLDSSYIAHYNTNLHNWYVFEYNEIQFKRTFQTIMPEGHANINVILTPGNYEILYEELGFRGFTRIITIEE